MKTSQKIVIFLIASFAVSGFIDGRYPDFEMENFLIHTGVVGFSMYAWCGLHANEHGIEPPPGAQILCFLMVPIGLIYYLTKSYGWKRGGGKLLFAILALALIGTSYELAYYFA